MFDISDDLEKAREELATIDGAIARIHRREIRSEDDLLLAHLYGMKRTLLWILGQQLPPSESEVLKMGKVVV